MLSLVMSVPCVPPYLSCFGSFLRHIFFLVTFSISVFWAFSIEQDSCATSLYSQKDRYLSLLSISFLSLPSGHILQLLLARNVAAVIVCSRRGVRAVKENEAVFKGQTSVINAARSRDKGRLRQAGNEEALVPFVLAHRHPRQSPSSPLAHQQARWAERLPATRQRARSKQWKFQC